MSVEYFGHSLKPENEEETPRCTLTPLTLDCDDDIDHSNTEDQTLRRRKSHKVNGVEASNIYKKFIAQVYQLVTNRLVRTAHLSDLSIGRKSNSSTNNSEESKTLKSLPPGSISLVLGNEEKSDLNIHNVKSVHIDTKILKQEITRLESLIKDRKGIFLGTKSIFPEIEVFEEFSSSQPNSDRLESDRTESVRQRKYFLRFTHLEENGYSSYNQPAAKPDQVSD